MEGGKVAAAVGRGAGRGRRGLGLSCSGASVGLLWCMFTAFLALPYWCFYAFGKVWGFALGGFCAGCAGLPSARRQGSGVACLVLVYLLCCCGACLRRSLRCHTCAFVHLERFDDLSSARRSSRGLRGFSLGRHQRNGLAQRGLVRPWVACLRSPRPA